MQSKDVIKLENNPEQKESQKKININNNPPIKVNNIINSSKDIRKTSINETNNISAQENYIKRNSPMQLIKKKLSLNVKKENKNNVSNSFYDFSPKIDNTYFPLTPQILPNDIKLLNKKYFPSKANVCKGNPDSNPKFIIPSSSPIVNYFSSGNIDNLLGTDIGFSLENNNSNCFGDRISHVSNISQSDMFNCSPSDFFNRNSYGVNTDKNFDGFFIDGGEDNKYSNNDEGLYVALDIGNSDINYDDYSIVGKMNEMKNKKKEKMNVNNSKVHKNSFNNKNNHKIKKKESIKSNNDNNKDKNVNMPIQNIIESRKKVKKKPKENINNKNSENPKTNNTNNNKTSNEKNASENDGNGKDNSISKNNKICDINLCQKNNSNPSITEDNNHENSQNISVEFSKKFEEYIDHFEESPQSNNQKKEDNYDIKNGNNMNIINDLNNKNNLGNDNGINDLNNLYGINNIGTANNIDINNRQHLNLGNENRNMNNYNMNFNNQIRNNNLSNNNNIDKNNLNYIKGMNIRCTNLNINNFTNLNNNPQNGNYYDQNQQLLNYIQSNNNQNNFMFNQNPNLMINDAYNLNNNMSNINNYNNYYQHLQRMNLYNMNVMNQMNPMNINNPFYLQNNLMQGYPFFPNNNINNNQNNIDLMTNNGNLNNNSLNMNNNQLLNNNLNNMNNINNSNQLNNNNSNNVEQKKKKVKRLEASMYVNKPLSFIAENFSMLGKDQGACRHIQKLLNDNPIESMNALYVPLCNNILQLINDPFGNYLIQKIITFLNDEQLYEILTIISPNFFDICCNTHGTRVLQKLVEHSTAPKVKNYFFELLKPHITPLLKQLNGTFVVQKFAEVNDKEYSKEINEIIVENSPTLATHRHGCCVIQKYLELKDPTMTPNLLNKLIDNCLLLIIDQFGNYVIQSILLMGDKKYGNRLANKIAENVVYYAKHKYSSNVVEKCFDYCDGIYLQNLMNNVQKKDNLTELILDEHGNYVVQKVLSLSKPNMQKAMLRVIVPLFEKLKNFAYGERVINRLLVSYPIINDNSLFANDNDIPDLI